MAETKNQINVHKLDEWRAYSFSSLFILDVATESQKDHKLFSATYNLCSEKIGNIKIEGSLLCPNQKCRIFPWFLS
jgi:hypothetical protein